ncbi:MAG TPA: aldo/keto reductase [Candidatus Hydrogenedentes bacterium]|nr:aldo/keto reductase [Candidatus Hydrogenedentota bacterium]HQM48883.1 aldo/keto reductase [Candidatus Hydrogenedentota bacterium]
MEAAPKPTAALPRRAYGETPVELSVIGFGGIVITNVDQKRANRVVAEAFERGVNYFDVAPTYGDAEIKLGPALEPYRKDVFLACKTTQRQRAEAENEFRQSLERLRTDHFDLYQLHGLSDLTNDVEPVFAKNGVMDMLLERKRAGQIRFLGFSAHTVEAAFAALDRYQFDSVLFPINFGCFYEGDFGPQVVQRAKKHGAARLALKAMALQQWKDGDPKHEKYPKCWYEPITRRDLAAKALRWTLSQPITAAIPPGEEELFWLAVDIASTSIEPALGDAQELETMAHGLNVIFRVEKKV